jgi:unsaturated chondroitin disaccharide hydrolase
LATDLVRPDGSTIHRLQFDPGTGQVVGPLPGQGLNSRSTWARGQAWALNGFAQAYVLSKDPRMLEAAHRTADYWMSRVPAGCIPAWDFSVSSARAPRDTSAAAIAADGLIRLAAVDPDASRAQRMRTYADATLAALLDPRWLDTVDGGSGLLHHQAYNVPADPREGTYVWGDTYLLTSLTTTRAGRPASAD